MRFRTFGAAFLSVVALSSTTWAFAQRALEPGTMYDFRAWLGQSWDRQTYMALGVDIDGQVGYRLEIAGPYGTCGGGAGWTRNAGIVTGQLPPGLTMELETGRISGIPAERGHWILTVQLNGIQCDGLYLPDRTQELRFHITGSGQVVQ